jgi:Family of unknown function (DUF6266)
MAKMEKGILGNFSGTIGGIVGYNRGGVQIIRSKSKKKKTKASPAQLTYRAKFGMVTRFLQPLRQFMNEAHKKSFKTPNAYFKLWSLNMQQIVQGEYPDFSIDYRKVLVTKGTLRGPADATVACARTGKLVFTWRESVDDDHGTALDRVYTTIYDDETKSWRISENAAIRKDGKCTLDITKFRGYPVQTYIGFISADGLRVSNSQYLGMVNVL